MYSSLIAGAARRIDLRARGRYNHAGRGERQVRNET